MYNMWPWAGPFLAPGLQLEQSWKRFTRQMFTKYQRHGPSGFKQEDFLRFFPYKGLCVTYDP